MTTFFFRINSFEKSCESFIQPDMMPVLTGYFITKPLVSQFVRNNVLPPKTH